MITNIYETDEKSKMLKKYLRFINKIVYEYDYDYIKKEFFEYDDLFQEACIGMLVAYKRFDKNRGVKFISYGGEYARLSILKFLQRLKMFGRNETLYKINSKMNKIKKKFPEISLDELAGILKEDKSKIIEAIKFYNIKIVKTFEDFDGKTKDIIPYLTDKKNTGLIDDVENESVVNSFFKTHFIKKRCKYNYKEIFLMLLKGYDQLYISKKFNIPDLALNKVIYSIRKKFKSFISKNEIYEY